MWRSSVKISASSKSDGETLPLPLFLLHDLPAPPAGHAVLRPQRHASVWGLLHGETDTFKHVKFQSQFSFLELTHHLFWYQTNFDDSQCYPYYRLYEHVGTFFPLHFLTVCLWVWLCVSRVLWLCVPAVGSGSQIASWRRWASVSIPTVSAALPAAAHWRALHSSPMTTTTPTVSKITIGEPSH